MPLRKFYSSFIQVDIEFNMTLGDININTSRSTIAVSRTVLAPKDSPPPMTVSVMKRASTRSLDSIGNAWTRVAAVMEKSLVVGIT